MDFPISDVLLDDVDLPDAPSAWLGHVPFGLWLVEMTSPETLVELGTHHGHSYFAFCAGVVASRSHTKCFAVDTWQGDEHAGTYGEEIFGHVDEHNRKFFYAFSRLLRMTFDDAAGYFGDGTIDFLHIDGLHTYEAVKHDFETWKPKLSSRAVVLFHDTNVRERDFGVWRLWEQLKVEYPHIEFQHSHGLGVLFVGEIQNAAVRALVREPRDEAQRLFCKRLFARLGLSVELQAESKAHLAVMQSQAQRLAESSHESARLAAEEKARHEQLTALREEMERLREDVRLGVEELEVERQHARRQLTALEAELGLRDQRIAALEVERSALLGSSSWKITLPYRWFGSRLRRVRRAGGTDG